MSDCPSLVKCPFLMKKWIKCLLWQIYTRQSIVKTTSMPVLDGKWHLLWAVNPFPMICSLTKQTGLLK